MKRPWLTGGLLLALIAAALWLARLHGENAGLRDDVADYQRQLREQSESAARSREELAGRIAELQAQLADARTLLGGVTSELESLREQVSPDYERLLRRAREEAANEQRSARDMQAASVLAVDPETARAAAAARVPELYGNFLAGLGLGEENQARVMAALVDFEATRAQLRADLLAGNLSPQQALDYFGSGAISANLGNLLGGGFSDSGQLAELQQYSNFLSRDAARLIYGETLSRMGAALAGEAGELALRTVLDELYSEAANHGALVGPDGSIRTAHNSQLAAFDRARGQLQGQLDAEQLNQLDRFLDARRNGMDIVLEASVDDSGGLRLRNERVAAENLPD
ncbi:MAG: hypothetical protein OXF82_01330 [Gammaproteobacteria bacterium]|nr:hypothetical protein [Gammaproteobacteria bacterium]